MTERLTVEIWSDLVCPWCYLGKRRFERALEQFGNRGSVAVRWRSFQLDPSATSSDPMTLPDRMQHVLGMSAKESESGIRYLTELAGNDDLDYDLCRALPVNSLDAHRMLHAAMASDREDVLRERLSVAYVKEGMNIADHDTLIRLASDVGLDPDLTAEILNSDAYIAEVRQDEMLAHRLGVRSVPTFVFGGTHILPGTPSIAQLSEALEHAWSAQGSGVVG